MIPVHYEGTSVCTTRLRNGGSLKSTLCKCPSKISCRSNSCWDYSVETKVRSPSLLNKPLTLNKIFSISPFCWKQKKLLLINKHSKPTKERHRGFRAVVFGSSSNTKTSWANGFIIKWKKASEHTVTHKIRTYNICFIMQVIFIFKLSKYFKHKRKQRMQNLPKNTKKNNVHWRQWKGLNEISCQEM